ncbi:MAG TPA: hypothetical protein VFT51_06975 [Bacillales bacterium]|nr:hypothetical protein [Bacillales bacterium]
MSRLFAKGISHTRYPVRMTASEQIGIIGPNGAGISTTVKALLGFMPSANEICVFFSVGFPVSTEPLIDQSIGFGC